MTHIENAFLSPFALNIVKDISAHKYLDLSNEYCLGNDFTELGYRIRKIHSFILDRITSLNIELDNQEEKGIINSEDDRLFVYLTESCDKLLTVIDNLDESWKIYNELFVTIHKTVGSEKLDEYIREDKS